ncbi:MAG: hypothetical protein AAGI07_05720 [Bacteroidota bacterium]
MIKKYNNSSNSMIRLIGATFFLSLLLMGAFVQAQKNANLESIEKYLQLSENQNMYVVIRASSKQSSLENIANEFAKKGVELTFSKFQFNENLLTQVALKARIGKCDSENEECFQWEEEAYNNGLPIDKKKPLIFYIYREGNQVVAAGISYGYPETILPKEEIKAMKHLTGSLIGILRAK